MGARIKRNDRGSTPGRIRRAPFEILHACFGEQLYMQAKYASLYIYIYIYICNVYMYVKWYVSRYANEFGM